MKIVIVGAGAAGLVTAKHALEAGHKCEILEMRPHLGGTWLYTDDVGEDKFGYPVFSATYKALKANLPKVLMRFQEMPAQEFSKDYGAHKDILKYLETYADHFKLSPFIKFNRFVKNIQPLGESQWRVISEDKIDKKQFVEIYDVAILCVGNCNEPFIPELPGVENFQGNQYHSREYRTAEAFAGKNVLVIGAGASSLDLAFEIASAATKVIHSHHSPLVKTMYPVNVEGKPDIRYIREREVEFEDGTVFPADVIFYATGYKYSFPFLDITCGITIKDNCVEPLYKHMIHSEKPTMCFIGIPIIVCAFPMFDLQARFYMKYLERAFELPLLEDMRQESAREKKMREEIGFKKTEAHKMLNLQESYYNDLAKIANITPLAPVLVNIFMANMGRLYDDVANFRNDTYQVLDNENFVRIISNACL